MKKKEKSNCIAAQMTDRSLGTTFINLQDMDECQQIKPAILLHSCCGPCSTSVVERLSSIYEITIFFYNPNITDHEEYLQRKQAQLDFIEQYNRQKEAKNHLCFLEGPYDPEHFFQATSDLEDEPEGGRRCTVCFDLRLEKTAEIASMRGFDTFTTALSVSPHKDFGLIAQIGNRIAMRYGLTFLAEDFKKQNGYQRSIELSKLYGLYRQKYCGCQFSDYREKTSDHHLITDEIIIKEKDRQKEK